MDQIFVSIASFKNDKKYSHEGILDEIKKIITDRHYKKLNDLLTEYSAKLPYHEKDQHILKEQIYEKYFDFRYGLFNDDCYLEKILKRREILNEEKQNTEKLKNEKDSSSSSLEKAFSKLEEKDVEIKLLKKKVEVLSLIRSSEKAEKESGINYKITLCIHFEEYYKDRLFFMREFFKNKIENRESSSITLDEVYDKYLELLESEIDLILPYEIFYYFSYSLNSSTTVIEKLEEKSKHFKRIFNIKLVNVSFKE